MKNCYGGNFRECLYYNIDLTRFNFNKIPNNKLMTSHSKKVETSFLIGKELLSYDTTSFSTIMI